MPRIVYLKVYSNLFIATSKTIKAYRIPIKIGHMKLHPKSTDEEILDGMEKLSHILKSPELGYLHKFKLNNKN